MEDEEPVMCEMTPLCPKGDPLEKLANILSTIDEKNKELNLCTFETTLYHGNIDDLDEPIESHKKQTLLQIACQNIHATRYAKILVNFGADPNGKQSERTPIYLSARYGCLDTLDYLMHLRILREDAFLCKDVLGNNLLHVLHDECARMVPLLVRHGVDVNHLNRKGLTPIHHQLIHNHLNVVKTILKYIDSLQYDDKNLYNHFLIDTKAKTRDLLLKKLSHQPELINVINRLPKNDPPNDLFQILYCGDKEEFFKRIEHESGEQNDGSYTLLQIAVTHGYIWAIEKLLQRGADHNSTANRNPRPLHLAASRGYHEIIRILLEERKEGPWKDVSDRTTTPLHHLLKNWARIKAEDRQISLKLLLGCPGLDINAREPGLGNTALHYATKLKACEAAKELLQNGAYIGARNLLRETPLASLDPNTLEQFLDWCVTDNEMNPVEDSYQVCFNYRFLFHPCPHKSEIGSMVPIDVENPSSLSSSSSRQLESDPLLILSRTRGLRHYLKHPIFSAFLYLKWQRIQIFFFINLLFYALFVIMACLYAVCYYGDAPFTHNDNVDDEGGWNAKRHCLVSAYIILLLLLAIREFFQMVVAPRHYFKSPENYLELGIILLSWVIICWPISSAIMRRHLAAVTILFCGVEMVLLIGRHPFLSTYIEMFKKVSWNFIKFLIWYLILILAFAMSFYILFRDAPTSKCERLEAMFMSNETDDDSSDQFSSVGHSMFKTIVMLTGEFDASDIPFGCLRWPSYILFILFVFLICMVLINLLNGLAVNDTTSIQQDAVLVSLSARVELIHYFERVLAQLISRICCLSNDSKTGGIGHRIRHRLNLQDLIPTGKIAILVNKNYQLVYDLTPENLKQLKYNDTTPCCCGSSCCSCDQHIEKQIVNDALMIISHKQDISLEELCHQMDVKVKLLTSRLDESQKTLNEILNLLKNQQMTQIRNGS